MNNENDKTLRGIFQKHRINVDEWNDRANYRTMYENEYVLSKRKRKSLFDIFVSPNHLLHEKKEYEEDYIANVVGKFFPESKTYQSLRYYWSFGMCTDMEGNYLNCDCCGIKLHFLNTTVYGMCDSCEIEYKYPYEKVEL